MVNYNQQNTWKYGSLKNFGDFKNGVNKGKEDFGHGTKFVNIQDIFRHPIIDSTQLNRVNVSDKEVATYRLEKGDILFVRSSVKPEGVGYPALFMGADEDVVYSGFTIRYRPVNGIFDSKFLLYTLLSDNFRRKLLSLATISANTNINQEALSSLEVPVPPIAEQRKIAAILSSVDEAIEKTETIIEQTEKVKKGLMQQLLTKGISHTRFKKTEIGEIPQEWEVRRLEEVTLPKEGIRRGPFGGALKKEIFVNEGYAVYEQQHVINNNMREFRYFIDEKKFLEMKQFEVIPGDILISCSGTVGKVALVPENAKKGIINQALLRLRLKNKLLSNLYAWYLFSSDFMQSKMTDMSHGSTLKNIVGMTELRKISIPIPPLDEQMEIVSILTSIDQMHQNELERLSQLQNIKKGLMQSLLTGKVRVRVDEDEVMSS
jgi:type I restriction enzyme, S subunit